MAAIFYFQITKGRRLLISALPALLGLRWLLPVSSVTDVYAVAAATVLCSTIPAILCYFRQFAARPRVVTASTAFAACAAGAAFFGETAGGGSIVNTNRPNAIQMSQSGET